MIGLGFTLGLTLGLLLQLPGVSSPVHARGRRAINRGGGGFSDSRQQQTTGAHAPLVISPVLEQPRAAENGEISADFNDSDLKPAGQTGHVPQISSANILPESGHAAKPFVKQTSGQNPPTESVSVLQVRIRQTKDTIENIKEQHGWNASKSDGKHDDKKPARIVSHRDGAEKTPPILRSPGSKRKTVSKAGVRKRQGSESVSSIMNPPHSENKENILLNSNKLDLHGDTSEPRRDSISESNELENGLRLTDNLRTKSDKLHPSLVVHDHGDSMQKPLPGVINGSHLFDGIYWSAQAEMMVPDSISAQETKAWRAKVRTQTIAAMKAGCGRQQNRLVQLSDGSMACARYRINRDQIQGEVFSYHLAQLLGIQNVPPAILALPDPSDPRWSPVLDQLISAQWNSDRVVVLTPWIENLNPVFIPQELRPTSRRLHPDPALSEGRKPSDISELVQWSDLIVLDYLTANVDRAVNNLYNLQWNSDMMSAPAHNLEKVGHDGPLVFLDNESGLFHSYRLLDKYSEYHESFLKALCVFKKSTAAAVKRLSKEGQVANELASTFTDNEPLHSHLSLPRASNMAVLQNRLRDVAKQMEYCDKLYKNQG